MSDHLEDTPVVIPPACPGCQPDLDPKGYDVCHCEAHSPSREGEDDRLVNTYAYLAGSSEAGGDDNSRWCDFFHREARS